MVMFYEVVVTKDLFGLVSNLVFISDTFKRELHP